MRLWKVFRPSLFFVILSLGSTCWSYPSFIGYSYTTCNTCHYNSQGNGPLTDYGRALFSQEIAARPFISKTVSDERLAEYSGFVPGRELPFWVRPSLKYRGLWLDTAPGGTGGTKRWIHMQRDVNLVFSFDPDSRMIFSATYGMLPMAKDYYGNGKSTEWVSREHYFRFYIGENFLVATGLMDKVYGIRTADHSAMSRSLLGFGQDDQAHGVLLEYNADHWTGDLHLFAGNLQKQKEVQQKGFSAMIEYTIFDRNRLGASLAIYENEFLKSKRASLHDRWGIANLHGTSVLIELGLKEDQKLKEDPKLGAYMFLESTILLTRGYSFVSTLERIQNELKPSELDLQKWTLGFLTFPFQRIEVRLAGVQSKGFSNASAIKDQYALQGQLHVSY